MSSIKTGGYMRRSALFVFFALFIAGVSYAADKDTTWDDNFVSNAVSDVCTKVNKFASGDEPIFTKDAKGVDNLLVQGHLDDRNAMGIHKSDVPTPSGKEQKSTDRF